jgi:hypothetical protein
MHDKVSFLSKMQIKKADTSAIKRMAQAYKNDSPTLHTQ